MDTCSSNTGVRLTSFKTLWSDCVESIVKFQGDALSDEWAIPMAHWLIVLEVGTDRKRHSILAVNDWDKVEQIRLTREYRGTQAARVNR